MNLEDVLGLVIAFGAFIFFMVRGALKQLQPETEEEEEIRPLPVQKIPKQLKVPVKAPSKLQEITVVPEKKQFSRAHHVISALKSKKDMVILKEIIGPAKGSKFPR